MTVPMQFKEVTIRLGFWEDADGFGITDEQWWEWLKQSVVSWNHKRGPHFSVKTATHTQEIFTGEEMGIDTAPDTGYTEGNNETTEV